MAKLIYSAITSLDGYVADEDGNFDWAVPDEEVHTFVNDLERPVGTYLYGRRMYEVMVRLGGQPGLRRRASLRPGLRGDLAGGRQDRVLQDAGDGVERQDADRAGLRPRCGPAHEGDGRSATSPWAVPTSPPRRSAPAWSTSVHLFVAPIVVGGGKRALPDGVRVELELLDERRFGNGMVHLHYRTKG